MNESLAITIMNDIISKNNEEVLNRIDIWKSILKPDNFIKLSYIYLSFIYEELITDNNNKIKEVKNNMKELLFVKEIDNEISRHKACIFTFINYKKEVIYNTD
jgi:hypothetical protein